MYNCTFLSKHIRNNTKRVKLTEETSVSLYIRIHRFIHNVGRYICAYKCAVYMYVRRNEYNVKEAYIFSSVSRFLDGTFVSVTR